MPKNPVVTYDRPVSAQLIVRLENGEEWPATPEDLANFNVESPHDGYIRFARAFSAALARFVVPNAEDLTRTPVNATRYLAECALLYHDIHNPLVDTRVQIELAALATAGMGDEASLLRLHLASQHAMGGVFWLNADELAEAHEHEHKGPGTIRNHDVHSRAFDLEKVALVTAEAMDLDEED